MSIMDSIIAKAKSNIKHIVLPEGSESRVVKAVSIIAGKGIAKITLLGDKDEIAAHGADLSGVEIINPKESDKLSFYAEEFYQLRKNKGMTQEKALETVKNNTLYFGTMMLKCGDADGMIAGAINSTGDVLRPALQIIKTAPGISIASSCFLMESPMDQFGSDGVMIFGDCAVIPNPTAQELAAIAIASAKTAKALADIQPKVAMLSFSTKGSAKHDFVTKVEQATSIVGELAPNLDVDGELQADAALVESVAKLKAPGSTVAGKANVLIFPDLQSGNIGYKLVERLGGAKATGPIIQGLNKPVNDLSRGCSVDDIVSVAAITSVMAQ